MAGDWKRDCLVLLRHWFDGGRHRKVFLRLRLDSLNSE